MVHFVLFLAVICAFSRYKDKQHLFICFWLLSGFAILRYNYGNDYRSYMSAYEAIRSGWRDPFKNEVFFSFLNKVTPSFYLLIALVSIFFLWVIYKIINKNLNSIYKGIGVLIFLINPYLFLMNLSALRQSIAMCIFIISIKYLQDRKLIKYTLMILAAAMFHTSALILIPIYFFVNDRIMDRFQTVILVIGMFILLFEGNLMTKIIEMGLSFFDNSDYIYHFSQGISNSLRATVLTGIYFVYVAINLVHLKGYKLICGKLYLIGLFLGMLAIYFSMLTRIQMYFDIFSIIAIPAIIEYHNTNTVDKWGKIIHLYLFPAMLFVIYLARYYSFFTNEMWNSFRTYHTIFEAIL